MSDLSEKIAQRIFDNGIEGFNRYYSVYRGIVVDRTDKEKCGVLGVKVPGIVGDLYARAYPIGQHGSDNNGFKYFLPQVGDIVWVSFEDGDASKATWQYHGWAKNQIPSPLESPNSAGIVTPKGNLIVIDEDGKTGNLTVYFDGNITINSSSHIIQRADGAVYIEGKGEVLLRSEKRTLLNGSKNDGLVNIHPLTQKLNQLVQEIEIIKAQLNTHTHVSASAGTPTTPMVSPITQSLSLFNAEDYMDNKCVH